MFLDSQIPFVIELFVVDPMCHRRYYRNCDQEKYSCTIVLQFVHCKMYGILIEQPNHGNRTRNTLKTLFVKATLNTPGTP